MKNNDLIKVSASMLVDTLSKSFIAYSNSNLISKHPAVFLKGSPGIGKSQSVNQIKKILEEETKREVNLVDVRLILFNPVDLRGIPIADRETNSAIWLRPEIFKLKDDINTINVLFLDELTSAPKSIQAAAYQIALDKRLGEHKLPNNTFVIAAGNKESDNAVTYEMPSALKNRFIHFEVVNNHADWLSWAIKNNINKEIIDFIIKYPTMLNGNSYESDSFLVTPRSWEMLSNMLDVLGGSVNDNLAFVESTIGVEMTKLLLNKKQVYLYEDIIENNIDEYPKELEELEQVTSLLEENINDYKDDENKINAVLNFINKLPIDYSIRVFRMLSKEVTRNVDLANNNLYKTFIKRIEVSSE